MTEMKTRPRAKTRIRQKGTRDGVGDVAPLSVRLTGQERALLADAATLRGWTPTNLLRVAALERAAQILNTSTPRKLDFAALARDVAARLCEDRRLWERLDHELDREIPLDDNQGITPEPLLSKEVANLREAVRLGGPEFLALVLAECSRLREPADPGQQLPDPIDPSSLS